MMIPPPRMFPHLPAATVSKALRKLVDEGLLRMVHYGRLSWYVASRKPLACRPKTWYTKGIRHVKCPTVHTEYINHMA